jgi:hypothetical protein
MRYSTGLVLAALSIGEVLASPTHAHLHKKAHQKKDVDYAALDWDAMGIDWTSAWAAGQKTKTTSTPAPTTTATSTTAAAAATTATTKGQVLIEAVKTSSTTSSAAKATSSAASLVSEVEALWSSIVGASNTLTEFGASYSIGGTDVGKAGNVGKPEGSNIIKVDSVGSNSYTNTFKNGASSAMTIVIWNKAASPKMADCTKAEANLGASIAPEYAALTFTLAPGASQIVAFAEDTQCSWAQATTDKTTASQFGTTWGEANFVSTGCGYDVSAIPNIHGNTYNMSISSTEVTCVSDMTQNYWLTDTQPIGNSDGSCYVPYGHMHLTTVMSGTV